MGFLRSRFTKATDKQLFHTSGVVGGVDAETLGATSAESFEQRQQLEHNRQLVRGYKSAGVMHNYRKEAQTQRPQQPVGAREAPGGYTDGQRAPRTTSNRIDVIKSSRQFGNVSRPGTGQSVPSRPSFREPPTRGFNPYK